MSRIQRIPTKQGHPVPKTTMTQGPFPRELYMSMPVVTEYQGISGNGGPEIPFGSTAQNNFAPLKWVRCMDCNVVLKESDTEAHECEVQVPLHLEDTYEDDLWDDDDEDDFTEGVRH